MPVSAEQFDEFGIPIKTAQPEMDEFGIPIKKKDSGVELPAVPSVSSFTSAPPPKKPIGQLIAERKKLKSPTYTAAPAGVAMSVEDPAAKGRLQEIDKELQDIGLSADKIEQDFGDMAEEQSDQYIMDFYKRPDDINRSRDLASMRWHKNLRVSNESDPDEVRRNQTKVAIDKLIFDGTQLPALGAEGINAAESYARNAHDQILAVVPGDKRQETIDNFRKDFEPVFGRMVIRNSGVVKSSKNLPVDLALKMYDIFDPSFAQQTREIMQTDVSGNYDAQLAKEKRLADVEDYGLSIIQRGVQQQLANDSGRVSEFESWLAKNGSKMDELEASLMTEDAPLPDVSAERQEFDALQKEGKAYEEELNKWDEVNKPVMDKLKAELDAATPEQKSTMVHKVQRYNMLVEDREPLVNQVNNWQKANAARQSELVSKINAASGSPDKAAAAQEYNRLADELKTFSDVTTTLKGLSQWDKYVKGVNESRLKNNPRLLQDMAFRAQRDWDGGTGGAATGVAGFLEDILIGFGKIGQGVADIPGSIYHSLFAPTEKRIEYQLGRLGKSMTMSSTLMYNPSNESVVEAPMVTVFSDPVKKQLTAIDEDGTMTAEQKRIKKDAIFMDGLRNGTIYTATNPNAGKLNLTATSVKNAFVQTAPQLIASIGMAAVGGVGSVLPSVFTMAYSDYYNEAVSKGNPNPHQYAIAHAGAEALIERVGVTNIKMFKSAAGNKGFFAKMIGDMSDKEIQELMSGTKGLMKKYLGAAGRGLRAVGEESFVEEGAATFVHPFLNNVLFGEDEKLGEGFKESVVTMGVGMLPLTMLGIPVSVRNTNIAQKFMLYDAATDLPSSIMALMKDVSNGTLSREQYNQRVKLLTEYSKAVEQTPNLDSKGEVLKDDARAKYAYNQFISNMRSELASVPESQRQSVEQSIAQAENDNTQILENATQESRQEQGVVPEGGVVQPERVEEGQREVRQGEGGVREGEVPQADVGDRAVGGERGVEEVRSEISGIETQRDAEIAAIQAEPITDQEKQQRVADATQRFEAQLEPLRAEAAAITTRELQGELAPQTAIDRVLNEAIPMASESLRPFGTEFVVLENDEEAAKVPGIGQNQAIFKGDDNKVYINKSRLADEIEAGIVVWHEAAHPVMNTLMNTDRPAYDRAVRGFQAAAQRDPNLKNVFDWANTNYSAEAISQREGRPVSEEEAMQIRMGEGLVETVGRVNEGLIDINKLDAGFRQVLIDFINKVAEFIGMKPILKDTDLATFKRTVSKVADALKSGRDITEVVGVENVKMYASNFVQARSIDEMMQNKVESEVQAGQGVSTRTPSSANAPTDIHTSRSYIVDLKSQREGPTNYISNAIEVAKYPLIGKVKPSDIKKMEAGLLPKTKGGNEKLTSAAMKVADQIYDRFVRSVADNLIWLYNSFDENLRLISRRWYDGANKMAQDYASKYQVTKEQAAGVMAVLSPQMDWYKNVSLAERVLDIVRNNRKFIFDQRMADKYVELAGRGQKKKDETPEEFDQRIKNQIARAESEVGMLMGKPLDAMPAYFPKTLRTYDETYNDKSYDVLSPNGEIIGAAKKKNGETSSVTWGGYSTIAKAISIIENGDVENISKQLGDMHKVRNFYNNIIDPNSVDGHVTIDTHAVAAGLLKPLAGSDAEVLTNLSGKSSSITGSTGTYPAFADAYRLAAKEVGILPRQMQSITWEAVRGLFKATWKANKENKALVNSIWDEYLNGKITIDEARTKINDDAGGVDVPSWARSGDQTVVESEEEADAGKLPSRGTVGRRRAGRGRTIEGGQAGMVQPITQASVGNRQQIIDQAKAAGTYLKAPNGKPTKLTENQWTTVRTTEFKNWFGDWEKGESSKSVLDDNGEPRVFYHGSPYDFEAFQPGEPIYLTSNKSVADEYRNMGGWRQRIPGGRVYDVFVRGGDILEIDAMGTRNNNLKVPGREWKATSFGNVPEGAITLSDYVKENIEGKDGVMIRNVVDTKFTDSRFKSDVIAVAEPIQVKSASENIGAFSPTDARIQASVGRRKPEGPERYEYVRDKGLYYPKHIELPKGFVISPDIDNNEGWGYMYSNGVMINGLDEVVNHIKEIEDRFPVGTSQLKNPTALDVLSNIDRFTPKQLAFIMQKEEPTGFYQEDYEAIDKQDNEYRAGLATKEYLADVRKSAREFFINELEYYGADNELGYDIPADGPGIQELPASVQASVGNRQLIDQTALALQNSVVENNPFKGRVFRGEGERVNVTYGGRTDEGLGAFYTDNKTMAGWFAGTMEFDLDKGRYAKTGRPGKISESILEIKNPYTIDENDPDYNEDSEYDSWQIFMNRMNAKTKENVQDFVTGLISKGHDGIALKGNTTNYYASGTYDIYVKFKPDQFTDAAEAYVKAKADGTNPELVSAVESRVGDIQASVGGRVENDTNFKLAAFVMRKKGEGASTVELVTSIASVMPGMSPQDIQSLINDPEAWLKSKFPGMTPEQQDNLIATAKRQNIYRGRKFGKPIDPAYHGLHVPDDMVEEYTKRNRRRDNAVKELFDRVFSKAYFTSSKGMPDWFLQVKDMATGAKNIEIERAAKTIEKLRKVAKSIGFSDWDTFSKALKDAYGTAPMGAPGLPMPVAAPGMPPLPMAPVTVPPSIAALPTEIIPFVYAMRGQIDNLTRDLIGFGYVTPEQAITLQRNIGAYVNRSYRIFTEKGYKPDKKAIDAAVKYFVDEKLKEIATDKAGAITLEEAQQQALDQAMKMVDDILDRKTNPYFRPSEVDRRNPGILKQRQDIPEPIRRLMGEYTDPGLVFMLTVGKQAALKASSQYLSEMRKNGMGTIFFEKDDPNRPLTHNIEVATMGSEALAPLGGLYTTQEVYDALMSMEPTYNNLTQVWMKTVGIVRWSKTVASLATQMKNFESNLGFAVMNGLLFTGSTSDAFKGAAKYVKNQYSDTEIDEITEKAIKLNLVGQAVGARELAEMLGSGDIHDVALDVALGPEGRWGRRVAKRINPVRILNKAYRLGDDFWKVYAYMNERQLVSRGRFDGAAYESLTPEQQDQVDAEASERVKNTWPTYDRVIEAAKFVSKRAPIVGNFISFQAESLRVLANTIKLAAQDIKDPQMRESGIRRMVGITSYVSLRTAITLGVAKFFGFAASGLLGAAFGDDDEERRKGAIKYAMPTFSRTGDFLNLPKDDAPHRYTVVNLSDLDPYGIIPRAFNALTEGREGIFGKTMEPGVPAAIAELFSSFLEPEMTFNAIWSLMNNNNIQTGERIVNESDSPSEVYDKAMGYLWKQLKPSTYAIYERLRDGGSLSVEAFALFGMRPYEVDLHKSWDYALSAMGRDMDAVIKEFNRVSYDDKATPEQKQAALVEAEMKKGIIINKYHEVYKNFILTGANPDILNQKLDEKSRTRMTGFDNLTKDALKTNKISSQFFKLKQDKQEKKEGYVEEGKSMEYKEEKPAEYKPE